MKDRTLNSTKYGDNKAANSGWLFDLKQSAKDITPTKATLESSEKDNGKDGSIKSLFNLTSSSEKKKDLSPIQK